MFLFLMFSDLDIIFQNKINIECSNILISHDLFNIYLLGLYLNL